MSHRWVLGVDIGGTNVVVGAVPLEGGPPVASISGPTLAERGGDATVATIAALAAEVIETTVRSEGGDRADFVGVGVGCPGPLDLEAGAIVRTPNLPWDGYPIRDRVAEALGLECVLDNDGNCAAYGEWWIGAAREAHSVLCLTLGTGIGGGFVEGGRVFRGVNGAAFEVGHITIEVDGRPCPCGNRGCLEAYASATAIAARARARIESGEASTLTTYAGGLEGLTARAVSDAARAGDGLAAEVIEEAGRMLGVGVASLVNVLNPEYVVVAGGAAAIGDPLFGPMRDEVRRRAFEAAADACRIVPGSLEGQAGVIGTAGIFVAESSR